MHLNLQIRRLNLQIRRGFQRLGETLLRGGIDLKSWDRSGAASVSHFAAIGLLLHAFSFVVGLSATAQAETNFDIAICKEYGQRHQSQSIVFRRLRKLSNLPTIHQQFTLFHVGESLRDSQTRRLDLQTKRLLLRQDKEFELDVVDLAKDPLAAGPLARSTTRNSKPDNAPGRKAYT